MAPGNELLVKVLGRRLSRVFTKSQTPCDDDRRPSTAPLVGQSNSNIKMTTSNKRHTIASPQSQTPDQPETETMPETKMEAQAPTEEADPFESFADTSLPRRRTVSSPPVPQPRLSRRASLRQRFWSISSANQFRELDDNDDKDYPSRRGTYIPRHAAASFEKSTKQRQRMSVHAIASERIASRFSDNSDSTTLCSLNCREEIPPELISRDLDLWLSTLHRQQALQALSTASDSVNAGPALSPVHADKHNRLSQTYHSWAPGAAPIPREPVVESDHSEDEYGVFADAAPEPAAPVRPVRNSVVWTDADVSSTAAIAAAPATAEPEFDPVLHRHSTYGSDLQPRTLSGFRGAGAGTGATATIPSYDTLTSFISPRPPSSLFRTRSEMRRTVCAKSPGVTTVIEA